MPRSRLVRCHTFISESTFGLPVYRWPPQQDVFDEILSWWRSNQSAGKASLIFAYALGKSQRIITGLAGQGYLPGPIFTHGAVEAMNQAYRAAGRHAAGHGSRCRGRAGDSLVAGPDRGPSIRSGHSLGPQVRAGFDGLCLGLDADSRHPPQAIDRSGIRPLRSRRLAQLAADDRRHRRRDDLPDPWLQRGGRPLAPVSRARMPRPSRPSSRVIRTTWPTPARLARTLRTPISTTHETFCTSLLTLE